MSSLNRVQTVAPDMMNPMAAMKGCAAPLPHFCFVFCRAAVPAAGPGPWLASGED